MSVFRLLPALLLMLSTASAQSLNVDIPSLPAGKQVQILYSATANANPTGVALDGTYSVSQQATISATGQSNALTDDPDTAAVGDATAVSGFFAAPPTVSVAVLTNRVDEDGATNLVYRFSRDVTASAVTVNFGLLGTATLNGDYTVSGGSMTGASGTITFGVGQSTADLTVDPALDGLVEYDETIIASLASGTGYDVGTFNSATGTIANDDSATLSIDDVAENEGDAGTTALTFTVTLDTAVDAAVSFDFATVDGSGTTADSDYTALTTTTRNFASTAAGATETITVQVNGDEKVELDESFFVDLTNLSAGGLAVTIADSRGQGTITNDESATLSIDDVTENEGASGISSYTFTVTLDNEVDTGVSFDYATADNTATVADSDYTAVSTTTRNFASIAAGATETITIQVNGDAKVELNESFYLNLSGISASGRDVTFADSQGAGTITNDDAATISIDDVSINEGASGTTALNFSVALSAEVDTGVSFNFATADDTGTTADSDYTGISSTTRNFARTAAGASETVTVQLSGDAKVELDETFFVNLSSLSAGGRAVTISDSQGQGTILNDDTATVSIDDVSQSEGDAGTAGFTFTVSLSAEVDTGVGFSFATADGTATVADSDYSSLTTTARNFASTAANATETITVQVNGDTKVESDESFFVSLSSLSVGGRDVTFADSQGQGTITNEDVDVVPPVITCPPDVWVEAVTPNTPDFVGEAVATDDVDPSPTISFSDVVTPGVFEGYTLVRTWTATDSVGNDSSCQQTITGFPLPRDFGDAPDALYPTTIANSGASHVLVVGGPTLGASVDSETDGLSSATAAGDDLGTSDDEDGITFSGPLLVKTASTTTGSVEVNLQSPALTQNLLNAWIDFNQNGSWNDPGEQIFTDYSLGTTSGVQTLNFTIPAGAIGQIAGLQPGQTFARFRLSTAGGLAPGGDAADGEVEDHLVTLQLQPVADLAISVDDGQTSAIPGESVTYTIVVSNAGPNTASSAAVANAFPATLTGVTYTSIATDGATGNTAAGAGDISDTVDLPTGASITYTANATVSPSATGSLANTATVTSSIDPDTLNNSATDTDTLTPRSDLSIAISDNVDPIIAGNQLTYTIVTTNSGPSDVVGATITDTFATILTGVTYTSQAAGVVSGNTLAGSGDLSETVSMAVGASLTYTVVATIDPAANGGLSNTVTIASATDLNSANNSATEDTIVLGGVDLVVTAQESADPITAGAGLPSNLTHELVVTNNGPLAATDLDLSVSLVQPAGVTIVSATTAGDTPLVLTPVENGATATWTLASLSSGSSETLTIRYAVEANAVAAVDRISSSATVASVTQPQVRTGDESATVATSVVREVDLVLAIDVLQDPLIAGGDTLDTFRVSVTNDGPSDASGVALSLTSLLPANVSFTGTSTVTGLYAGGVWTVGTLASGASATLTFAAQAGTDAVSGTDVVPLAFELTSVNEAQSNTANDTASETTSIISAEDTDATISVSATIERQRGLFVSQVTVTNENSEPIPAFRLYVKDLPADVQVYNSFGSRSFGTPAENLPFILYNQALDASSSVTLSIEFFRPSLDPNFSPSYAIELLPAPETVATAGTSGILVTLTQVLGNGDVLVEIASVPGATYAVEYSSDMDNWTRVLSTIVAPANRLQWIDNGPPKTESRPADARARFYRFVEITTGGDR